MMHSTHPLATPPFLCAAPVIPTGTAWSQDILIKEAAYFAAALVLPSWDIEARFCASFTSRYGP